jgi:hypothetical protein
LFSKNIIVFLVLRNPTVLWAGFILDDLTHSLETDTETTTVIGAKGCEAIEFQEFTARRAPIIL